MGRMRSSYIGTAHLEGRDEQGMSGIMQTFAPVFLLLLVFVQAARTYTAAVFPLFSVEAYYWLWGRHLAAGYVDHPPMVAWMSAIFFGWIDLSELAARTSPLILGIISSIAFAVFARQILGPTKDSFYAAAIFLLVPIFQLNGILLQPDNGLVLFTILTWLLFWKAANDPDRRTTWVLAGACAGGALLSKFHAWVLLPPLWAFLLFSPKHRVALKRAGPWLAAATALLVLSPNLVWNAQHDWLNYRFQWQRSSIPRAMFQLEDLAHFVVLPLITLSPVVYLGLIRGTFCGLKQFIRTRDDRVLFLLCAGLPLPLLLAGLSPFVAISPHWPAAGFPALILLWCLACNRPHPRLLSPRAGVFSAAVVSALLFVLPHAVGLLPGHLAWPGASRFHSVERYKREFLDWSEIGKRIRARFDSPVVGGNSNTFVAAKDWHMASLLAFYCRMPHNTFVYEAVDAHNFALWSENGQALKGRNAIIVIKKSDPRQFHKTLERKYDKFHRELDPLFAKVDDQPSVVIFTDGHIEEWLSNQIEPGIAADFLIFHAREFGGVLLGDTALFSSQADRQ